MRPVCNRERFAGLKPPGNESVKVGAVERKPGTVSISTQVLGSIARLTTLSVPGVLSMYRDLSGGFDRWLRRRGGGDGVRIEVSDDALSVDLYVIAARGVSLYELGREIQSQVARSVKDMIGMPVLAVNVHIADVARADGETEDSDPEELSDKG